MSELIGKKVLNYRIEKLLGQGGMGEVYLGVHTEIERKVAIKVISPHLAQDKRVRERFKREALILSRLSHLNIVQLHDFWDRPEGLFLIMEYVDGISLDRYIHRVVRGPLPLKLAVELFLQVLDAFQYAHDQGVIHRDIKPSNILVGKDNIVKILDFGIARILSGDGTQGERQMEQLTRTGTTLGTVAYMSPEQIKAKSPADIDHRSDIYSLGVVFFEMLTGQPAYDRTQHSEFDLLLKIATEPPPSLLSISPNLPPQLEVILQKALAKNPADRYQTCAEFAAELMRLMAELGPALGEPTASAYRQNPALTAPTIAPSKPSSSLRQTFVKLHNSLLRRHTRISRKTYLLSALLITLVGAGGFALITWYLGRQEHQQALQVARDFAEKALRHHDIAMLSTLLSDTLQNFFDRFPKSLSEIQKNYLEFWQSIQKDSVSWIGELKASKQNDTWLISGQLYYLYTTKPRKEIIPKKRYNKLWAKYEVYNEIIPIPSQTICKIKTVRLQIHEGKITGIEQLSEVNCGTGIPQRGRPE